MNLIRKDSGTIKIFGKDNIQFEKEIKNRIGFVYDDLYFYENLSIEETKNTIAPFYSKWDDELFYNYLNEFGLNRYMIIKELSKGMKMKFSLSLALSHHADFIIMDEPTAGLDPIIRRELLDILRDIIQDERKAIFFSTHITTDLEKIADYITFINRGRMVFSKSIEEVFDTYKLIKGDTSLIGQIYKEEFIGLREHNLGFEGLVYKDIANNFDNKNILFEKPSLEDIMYYHIKGNKNAKTT
jgi:ABC-2 type transport system ATP-binding protein